jgi:cob(I)alamin adenosyltransferase
MPDKGLVHIYTGCGKGKTTASLGLALRAAGHGRKVLICQFLKPAQLDLGERTALDSIDLITLEAFDQPWDMQKSLDDKEAVEKMRLCIKQTLASITEQAAKKMYDIIILDEIVFCIDKDLADLTDIKNMIEKKNEGIEIVMTGRGANKELIELADLVTEMKSIKHPFAKGMPARKGIEF